MPRELCSCRKPIISLDSYVETVDGVELMIQEYGCRNKDCKMYDVPIRETRTPLEE